MNDVNLCNLKQHLDKTKPVPWFASIVFTVNGVEIKKRNSTTCEMSFNCASIIISSGQITVSGRSRPLDVNVLPNEQNSSNRVSRGWHELTTITINVATGSDPLNNVEPYYFSQ